MTDILAEIQRRRVEACIEQQVAELAEFTGEAFARHVFQYRISFYMEVEQSD